MYKVVVNSRGVRMSANADCGGDRRLVVEYVPGEWVEARVGGLLVFDNLVDALGFVGGRWRFEVWECEVRDEVRLPRYRLAVDGEFGGMGVLEELWCRGELGSGVGGPGWPPGTRAFRGVRLVRLVRSWPFPI